MSIIMPPIPDTLAMPFYYATLQTHWLYIPVDLALARRALAQTGCEPYVFSDQRDHAVAVINFQRYTNTGNSYLGTTSEVELNLLVYPRSAEPRLATSMTLAQYAYGEDYQKVIGPFRLHVPADNSVAVSAGRELFGEPKFVCSFSTAVPSPNNPPPTSPIRRELRNVTYQSPTLWDYTVYTALGPSGGPYTQGPSIYSLKIDLAGLDPIAANASELVEYGHLDLLPPKYPLNQEGFAWTEPHPPPTGALVGGRWMPYGAHALYFLRDDTPYSLTLGNAMKSPMRLDMERLVLGRKPVLAVVFDSPPAAVESRAFYVDPPGATP